MTERVLIDTSAWVDALRREGEVEVRSQVAALVTSGQAVFCDLVLLELWNGARGTQEQKVLRGLERDLEKVDTSTEVWDLAVDLARRCRAAGMTVPATDLLVAAVARHHRLLLLHRDAHFDQIDQAAQ
ncbi:MAG: PIN domain-containing protein [Acidobacteriota bacterium]